MYRTFSLINVLINEVKCVLVFCYIVITILIIMYGIVNVYLSLSPI